MADGTGQSIFVASYTDFQPDGIGKESGQIDAVREVFLIHAAENDPLLPQKRLPFPDNLRKTDLLCP